MPVWIEPKGSKKAKRVAFVAYLLAMKARIMVRGEAAYQSDDVELYRECLARAEVYNLVATQLMELDR